MDVKKFADVGTMTHEEDFHTYSAKVSSSPVKKQLRKKVHALQVKFARERKKVDNLRSALDKLKEEKMISSNLSSLIHERFVGVKLDLIKNELANQDRAPKGFR